MKVMPYIPTRKYDEGVEFILSAVRKVTLEESDDFFLMFIGGTSTGKSRFMLWWMDAYLNGESKIEYIGLNKGDFASALNNCKKKELPRFCGNDEANISNRETQTKYNRDVIDVYYSIRGLRIFHAWCNPSLDGIDKKIIEDLVKGVVFTFTKYKNQPRLYYYFTKEAIIKILEKYGDLKLRTIKKVAKEYAFYRGWFRDYDGPLLKQYMDKKDKRMEEKIDNFHSTWGNADIGYLKKIDICRKIGVSKTTFLKYEKMFLENGIIKKEDYQISTTGNVTYRKEVVDTFIQEISKLKFKHINENETMEQS